MCCTAKKDSVDRNEIVNKRGVPMMSDVISVAVSASEKPSLLHGPVPGIVAVKNISSRPVHILLPYPNPNDLSFECKSAGLAEPKEVEREEIERTVPIAVDPGETHVAVYYLNRYLDFQKEGQATVSYRLETVVTSEPGTQKAVHRDVTFEGEFTIGLIQGTEWDLRDELATYAGRLQSSNRQVKMESAEALAFLDVPLSAEYVARMLSIDNLKSLAFVHWVALVCPRRMIS